MRRRASGANRRRRGEAVCEHYIAAMHSVRARVPPERGRARRREKVLPRDSAPGLRGGVHARSVASASCRRSARGGASAAAAGVRSAGGRGAELCTQKRARHARGRPLIVFFPHSRALTSRAQRRRRWVGRGAGSGAQKGEEEGGESAMTFAARRAHRCKAPPPSTTRGWESSCVSCRAPRGV